MIFRKPEVEFVAIELGEVISTSTVCSDNSGNVEYCSGDNAPMNQQPTTCSGSPMWH